MIYTGDCLAVLRTLRSESVDCCITSPPYWGLRDYGIDGQLGLEKSPEEYVSRMVEVFREIKRVLKASGTLWLNLGDSYIGNSTGSINPDAAPTKMTGGLTTQSVAFSRPDKKAVGFKNKDLCGIPWRSAMALQSDGWYLRQDIIWSKLNAMPDGAKDRCTKAHEYVFLLTKSQRYYYDNDAIKERCVNDDYIDNGRIRPGKDKRKGFEIRSNPNKQPGSEFRNKRSVWTVNTKPFKGAHFATFPEALIEPMVLAGCPERGVVIDPFFGAGTVGVVAKKLSRMYIGIELNPEYVSIARDRINKVVAGSSLLKKEEDYRDTKRSSQAKFAAAQEKEEAVEPGVHPEVYGGGE